MVVVVVAAGSSPPTTNLPQQRAQPPVGAASSVFKILRPTPALMSRKPLSILPAFAFPFVIALAAAKAADPAALWSAKIQPLLDLHCIKCHGLIDSRDCKPCSNGWLICPDSSCKGCCPTHSGKDYTAVKVQRN